MFATINTTLKCATAFGATALLMIAGAASATEFQSNGRTFGVHHGDLDLSQKADQKILNKRIAYAATKVCNSYNDLRSVNQCRALAIANVKGSINTAVARAETSAETSERYADAGHNRNIAAGH